jgi:hypothetical protein
MTIKHKETGRIFTQDGDWQSFHRDWNHDGDVYSMTVGFFNATKPTGTYYLDRIELCPDDIGQHGDYIEVSE